MALPPDFAFAHPRAGRLRVVFSGLWSITPAPADYRDWSLLIRGFVGEGADRREVLMDYASGSGVVEVPYAGGYAEVLVGMEVVSHVIGGTGTIKAEHLGYACHLME